MNDEYNLQRFVVAQAPIYDTALSRIRRGIVEAPWLEFVFPCLAGTCIPAGRYTISSVDEAEEYVSSALLGGRYRECARALFPFFALDIYDCFGPTLCGQLHASLTLFSVASPREILFETMFDVWFDGCAHESTMRKIRCSRWCLQS